MQKGHIAAIAVVILIMIAGGYILLTKYPDAVRFGSQSSGPGNSGSQVSPAGTTVVYQNSAESSSASGNSNNGGVAAVTGYTTPGYVYAGEVAGTPSMIKQMDLFGEPVDWDGEPGNDGIVIHFTFYDEYGRKVIFGGSSISATVTAYTPSFDKLQRPVSPRKVLYKGYATITSSDEGSNNPLSGLRIPYSELNTGEYDLGIGQIKVNINLPAGGEVTAEETYLYTRK
ncbi:hypothetical protein [Methanoplanus limicola]|uniref:Uncharacterized protein n=1 Tax=Methanoplanus limicola DSM 2279 TaxID=937775 RepID=H1Z3J4_9EURY|nr:hypothetical protein [Methanoplanus limicola]EHQ34789.1 hypothetical protein Metlim_0666 [Methanoplanus limicola DSM 2279]